jgi:3-hydroxyisobutyrate dehydrogenase
MTDDAVVAVLGTGIMGAAMARNLVSAGMEVRVWNRSREKARPLAEDGAKVAGSPAETGYGEEDMATVCRVAYRGQEKQR